MARETTAYLIAEVRRLTGAGTAEYAVDSTSYFTDNQIEQVLDSRRIRLARVPINYEYELSGGTTIYTKGYVGYKWLEGTTSGGTAGFIISNSQGSVIAGTLYTLSPEDGYVEFTADQHGSLRYVTGWIHNPYKAAVDILTSWIIELGKQVDWASDNMRVNRGQKAKALRGQIDLLKEMGNMAPNLMTVEMYRPDIDPKEDTDEAKLPIVYDKIP